MIQTRGYYQMTDEELRRFEAEAAHCVPSRRLKPEDVYKAFQDRNYKPAQHLNISTEDRCCCGITAVNMANGGCAEDAPYADGVVAGLKLNNQYVQGFMCGWDWPYSEKCRTLTKISKSWSEGWDDGVASWKLCRHFWRKDGDPSADVGAEDSR